MTMVRVTVATLLIACIASVWALPTPKGTHVFMEVARPIELRHDLVRAGRSPSDAYHEVIFVTQERNFDKLEAAALDVSNPASKNYGKYWTVEQIAALTANYAGRDAIMSYLRAEGVSVHNVTTHGEFIVASAPVNVFERMFDTEFYNHYYAVEGEGMAETAYFRADRYSIPAKLHGHVFTVLNTVQMPSPRPRRTLARFDFPDGPATAPSANATRLRDIKAAAGSTPIQNQVTSSMTPAKLIAGYNIDSTATSKSSTQAIFATPTGSNGFNVMIRTDLAKFQSVYNIPSNPISKYMLVAHQGFPNTNDDKLPVVTSYYSGNQVEVCPQGFVCDATEGNLDVQYITAIAQGAPTSWAQTLSSNNNDPFTNLMLLLVQNLARFPLVFSISYGASETAYGTSYLKLFDQTAQKVALTGRTILAASGDSGAMADSCATGYQPNFPGSSSWVTAVGATQGVESGTTETVCMSNFGGTITGGGGFSTYSTLPVWQATQVNKYFTTAQAASKMPVAGYGTNKRGYPDVSLSGASYLIYSSGKLAGVSGTSASCPVFAGMLTLINAARLAAGQPSLGFVNPALYAAASTAGVYNDITTGSNNCLAQSATSTVTCCTQGYTAIAGWDPASGLGSPNFKNLKSALLGNIAVTTAGPTPMPSLRPPTQNPTTGAPTPFPTTTPVAAGSPTTGPSASTPTVMPNFPPTPTPTQGIRPVVTGYAVVTSNFGATDTQCASPNSYSLYSLGQCISFSGATYGLYYSADTNGQLYVTSYSSPTCLASSQGGTFALPQSSCTCNSGFCSKYWFYLASMPSLPGLTLTTNWYLPNSNCQGPTTNVYLNNKVTACSATGCLTTSDGSASYSTTCSGSAPTAAPTAGLLTTGFAAYYSYGADSACGTASATTANVLRLGVCFPTTTGYTRLTASAGGTTIFVTTYAAASCTGTPLSAAAVPTSNACTQSNGANGFTTSGTYYVYSYLTSLPTFSVSNTLVTSYIGSTTCAQGTEYGYSYTLGVSSCTPASCAAGGGSTSSATTCSLLTTASAGPISTGFAVMSGSFAAADTTCQTPLTGTLRPLGVCVPNNAAQAYILSADSKNNLYVTYYANTACTGAPTTTSAPAAQPCTCTAAGCTAGFSYYGASLPTYPAGTFVLQQTQFSSTTCGAPVTGYTYTAGTTTCIPSACVTSATNGYTFGYTTTCATTAAPSAAPIVTNIVVVTAQTTLTGVSSTTFMNTPSMQQAYIASLVKGANLPQNAIVTIINAVRRNRRNMLDATTVTTSVQTNSQTFTPGQLTNAMQNQGMQAAVVAGMSQFGVTGAVTTAVDSSPTNGPTPSPVQVTPVVPVGSSSGGGAVAAATGGGGGGGGAACFAATELLTMENGATKAMADLAVGDRVLTVNAKGEQVYSDVAYLPHGKNAVQATFAVVTTASGRDLKMTANHMLPAGACAAASLPVVPASAVAVGDCVQTVSGRERVVSVSTVAGAGIYTVIAMEELLVVNGIVATPYGGVNPTLANVYYNLHRLAYSVAGKALLAVQGATEGLWGTLAALSL